MDGEPVLDVEDPFLGERGRYLLTVRDGQADRAPTDREPDLSLDVGDLGSVYLGGTTPSTLVRAGHIRAHRPGPPPGRGRPGRRSLPCRARPSLSALVLTAPPPALRTAGHHPPDVAAGAPDPRQFRVVSSPVCPAAPPAAAAFSRILRTSSAFCSAAP